jgi:splicing factor 3A subunit 1
MELAKSTVDTGIGERSVKLDNARAVSLETHTQTVGVIIPPPDVRVIVDKTAQFVGKNGPEFEQRILASEKNNVKFNFLTEGDPYHAYYRQQVDEAKAQANGTAKTETETRAAAPVAEQVLVKPSTGTAKPVVLEPPKSDEFTIPIPAGISSVDLDVIKTTAQFAARNGKKFVTALAGKEHANPQFNFLKPHHSMFTFFTALADAYEKILAPDTALLESLEKGSDKSVVLERVLKRVEWESAQNKAKKDKEDAEEEERIQMALIDWHSFVVVETLDFEDAEDRDLPPPMQLNEVVEAMRKQELEAPSVPEDVEGQAAPVITATMDEEERELVRQATEPRSNPEPPVVENVGAMKVVRNYKKPEERKTAVVDSTKFVVSPITGEMIPLDQMAEHMRISLIDPKWKIQREAMMAKLQGSTQASHEDVAANVLNLARNRPDIFGSTDDEVSKAINAEMLKKRTIAKANAPSPSIAPPSTAVAPPPPTRVAPPPPPPPPKVLTPPPPPAPQEEKKRAAPEPEEEVEPEPKKLKVGDVELDDESEFLEANPGEATINVVCPTVEGDSSLTGQTLEIKVSSLADKIVDLKRSIKPLAGDLAQNKQKLSTLGLGFLKDTASLAYYNLKDGSTLNLSIKARGKR